MARAIWKGAISFGLVHIPVSLNTAVRSERVDFDWLDKRSMEPVGYKRVNKVTGKEIDKEHIVKGVEYEKGRYVVISEEEIRKARPEATQPSISFRSSTPATSRCSSSTRLTT
jgi:DNA end-binding protein Ku